MKLFPIKLIVVAHLGFSVTEIYEPVLLRTETIKD